MLIDTRERRHTSRILASKRDRWRGGDADMAVYADQAPAVVDKLAAALRHTPVDHASVGALLLDAQRLLAERVHCSTPLIDVCVQRCMRAGAYGAKLTGSGHGGCLFALVPESGIGSVLRALDSLPVHVTVLTTADVHGVTCSFSP